MIHPHARRVSDRDAVVIQDVADLQVLQDHVGRIEHVDALAGDVRRGLVPDKALVGANLEPRGKLQRALQDDGSGISAGDGSLELRNGGDGDGWAALAAGGLAEGVVFGVALDVPGGNTEPVEGVTGGQACEGAEYGFCCQSHYDLDAMT